ncbi:family 43 glycosylhydrolase [Cellulosimicrobium cellulans]|uniref:family 43 glycosylhydrolase n=1 Tax=Cellulosimicrobium cellulans TaxID=1710 RepID=UPI0024076551|nr:family 43 glycosylhydrolase [Cellulosimicrobium cellulans]MDF9876639.1 arabinan endo-1,5-alpha-L-arabinosidase [Cellulosimicrobium cellulans]
MKFPLSRARSRATAVTSALVALGLAVSGAAAATAAPAPASVPAAATAVAEPTISPVVDANFPDPDILLVDGVYHAYATNHQGQNVQHRTSTDLVTWSAPTDVAPDLGAWVSESCTFAPGGATDRCVWAPEVSAVEGGYALYYTARDATSPRQCLGVALSDTPDGPFVPVGDDPIVCPNGEAGTEDLGGAIDAATFVDGDQLYLLWKADGNCCTGKTAIIFAQPLSPDGATLTGPPVELIRVDKPYEGRVVEGPTLLERDGTYYLFYSANDFGGGGYRTSYATASSLAGPWTKATTELLTSDRFQGDVRGPGGQDIVTAPDGSDAIVFHGWNEAFTYRAMYVADLEWTADGVPFVPQASDRYQAEDGVVTNARVVADGAASGGAKVGGLDFADSSVTVEVHADEAGPALLGIRFANGSFDGSTRVPSTSTLAVNGEVTETVVFPHTTWGNWQTSEHVVDLVAGTNTITLTRGTFYTELDAFDVYPATRDPRPSAPPVIPSDATRYEFEDGVITRGSVGSAAGASGGQKVGGLDFLDSSVALQVHADEAGPYTLGVRFANGSERGGYTLASTSTVTVNGADAGVVTFPHTTWGNWQSVTHQVDLEQGWNTVALTKLTWYTELDALDVFPAEVPPVDPQVTVTAQARCLGGTPYLAVRATNGGDETVAIALRTEHGERSFAQVDPGKNAYQSFKARGDLDAGEALVVVTDVSGTTTEVTAAYDALTCA